MYKNKFYLTVIITLFSITGGQAQNADENALRQQFADYRENVLQEKIFLHTDKAFYLAGEICWFKIYCVDAFFHRPLPLSKLAYVEILDKNNKPVLQAKIALKEGDGNGSLQLPLSMSSGMYKLRAYTNWMKNFSADYFFEKTITVANSRKVYEADTVPAKPAYTIRFFPEGGNLVNNIQSRIAFQVVDQHGIGISCEGAIINERSDTVIKYATLKFGIGSFIFTPDPGHSYKAFVVLPGGRKLLQDLPAIYNNGYVMHLEAAANDQLKITVQSTDNNPPASVIYLFVHTRNSVKSVLTARTSDHVAAFSIDKNILGDGISHFTVFNANRHPVCERLYFTFPRKQLQAGIVADAKEYDLRKKIRMQVSTSTEDGRPVQADMSMAVYRIDSLQGTRGMDINSYLWLSSDLAGTVESPGYYFSGAAETAASMDNLMLTHGWRRFRWEDVLQNNKPAFKFTPEFVGHIINGKITKTGTGQPAKTTGAYLSVPGTRTQFKTAISDNDGRIKFDLRDSYNEGEIIVQTDNREDSLNTIEIFNPFATNFSGNVVPPFSLTGLSATDLQNQHIAVQVQNVYNDRRLKQFLFPPVDTVAFYVKPDVSYLLDNFVRFTTMEEVLREYVAPVNVKRRNGKFHLPVMDESRRLFFEIDPLVLLDGVPVFDIDKLMNYDPLKIRKLDVVSRMYFLNNMFFEGVVNFTTYKGNLEGYELDPHATVIDYEGLQLQREFYAPVYDTREQAESRLPDFRNLLYWSPQIKTNNAGKQEVSFYSSDLPGKYAVVLQGLTADGKAGSQQIQFEVKANARVAHK
jgi:hypothetical protein